MDKNFKFFILWIVDNQLAIFNQQKAQYCSLDIYII
jgi:hypothetical protein